MLNRLVVLTRNRVGQSVESGGRIPAALANSIGILVQSLRPKGSVLDASNDGSKVEALVVGWEVLAQQALHVVTAARTGAVAKMQKEPQLDARVRHGQLEAIVPRHADCLMEARVLIAIEDAPDLIKREKIVSVARGVAASLRSPVSRKLHQSSWIALLARDFDHDSRIPNVSLEAANVVRFSPFPFTHDQEPPFDLK